MNKSEVLTTLSNELELSKKDTNRLYRAFASELTQLLTNDKGFTLPALGSFRSELRASRISYNPHYKKKVVLPEKKVVRFRSSSVIRNELNGDNNE